MIFKGSTTTATETGSRMFRLTNPFVLLLVTVLCPMPLMANSPHKEPWQLAQETEAWSPTPTVITANENTAPSDAIVLFNGINLEQWQAVDGSVPLWTIQQDSLVVNPTKGSIKTKENFCDIQLHIEWKTPENITDQDGKLLDGQDRSNSGIFLQERYEIQVLDSFNNKTYSNGQAGAIYKQSIPLVNASRAPGIWQAYDIIYTAPVFTSNKKLKSPAYVTVLHNGVLIQNHVAIKGSTEWIGKPIYKAHGCAPLLLQDHGSPVSYRNIWLRKL